MLPCGYIARCSGVRRMGRQWQQRHGAGGVAESPTRRASMGRSVARHHLSLALRLSSETRCGAWRIYHRARQERGYYASAHSSGIPREGCEIERGSWCECDAEKYDQGEEKKKNKR